MENDPPDIEDTQMAKEGSTPSPGSGRIRFYTSFSESEREQYLHWAKLSPEERLSEFFSIMSRFYVFTKPDWKGTKIHVGP